MKTTTKSLSVLFLTLALSSAVENPDNTTAEMQCDMESGTVTYSLFDPSRAADINHWRLEMSEDMINWSRISALEIHGGGGSIDIDFTQPGGNMPERMFLRSVLDNSVENVLNLPDSPYDYAGITLPPHLNTPRDRADDNTPDDNPVTNTGASLGRVLFYDKKLSINNAVSCASCHQQEHGFSDPDAFSTGFDGGLTGRNSMGLTNAQFYRRGHFFWDERADTLEIQTLLPIQNEVEMGMDLTTLVGRLQGYEYYQELFTAAFGDSTVTSDRISRALSQFVRSILSYQSKFDEGVATNFSSFTAEENLGRQIFNGPRGNCAACHTGPNFVGTRLENNGLEFPFVDNGAGDVTGNAQDNGKFKMSSLRNIEKTAPYMHDGRHATLEDVIDHYSTGVIDNPSLGPALRNPPGPGQPPGARRPNFTQAEKDALVAFLKTLTDTALLTDSKYANPFE